MTISLRPVVLLILLAATVDHASAYSTIQSKPVSDPISDYGDALLKVTIGVSAVCVVLLLYFGCYREVELEFEHPKTD